MIAPEARKWAYSCLHHLYYQLWRLQTLWLVSNDKGKFLLKATGLQALLLTGQVL